MVVVRDIRRLNKQFAVWIGFGVFVPILVVGYLWIHHMRGEVEEELHNRQEQVLETLSVNMLEPLHIFLPETASMQVKLLMQDKAVYSIRVSSTLFDMDLASFVRSSVHDGPIFFARKHLFHGGEVLGFVELALSRAYMDDMLAHRCNEVIVFLAGLFLAITILLYAFYRKRVVAPFVRLQTAVDRLSANNFDSALDISSFADDVYGNMPKCIEKLRSEFQKARLQVAALTTRDPVAQIPYQDLFVEIAARELSLAARFGLPVSLMLFSNDDHDSLDGQARKIMPDAFILRLVNLIRPSLHRLDVLGRWDERTFVLLMPEQTLLDAVSSAEELCNMVAEEFAADGVTYSFGIAAYWGDDTVATLFERADSALYQAEEAGGNCVKKA